MLARSRGNFLTVMGMGAIVGSSIIVDMIYDYNDVEAADVVFFLAPKWEYDS